MTIILLLHRRLGHVEQNNYSELANEIGTAMRDSYLYFAAYPMRHPVPGHLAARFIR
jgi:hypothetical protein